ncbi:SMI1/KNR4 family protein [Glycomyces artemisiae]|uniref:SMI1/KNR4 family protein n=1 Tax=Glycomyces artemisiae TaxID=1076443 RepID=UPI0015E7B45D|nr:SMI1/KNR4 family protein [Glycomyces artemisiae]
MAETDDRSFEGIESAWARVEAALRRVLPDSLPLLAGPAAASEIDAIEAALEVVLPPDFRASLGIHNGSNFGGPAPVPLDHLFSAGEIVAMTQAWDSEEDSDLDSPPVMAYLIDRGMLHVSGPVRPTSSLRNRVVVGTMNGDVNWFIDLDPPEGGTPGQVVRLDIECSQWDVLAPSWTALLVRYAEDLERSADDPERSTLVIDELGPACEWGIDPVDKPPRPAWLRDVQARPPRTWTW